MAGADDIIDKDRANGSAELAAAAP